MHEDISDHSVLLWPRQSMQVCRRITLYTGLCVRACARGCVRAHTVHVTTPAVDRSITLVNSTHYVECGGIVGWPKALQM